MTRIRIATRKSPLALVQAELVSAHLRSALGVDTVLVKIVTTGDRQTEWSLEGKGGKGLFTGELEQSLLREESDIAVHSAKDLPGEMSGGLALAGYLPRADPHDVLVRRTGVTSVGLLATASPRRRLQSGLYFPGVRHTEIRGNVDTRLRKIAEGQADATILAAAGLARLGIASWQGVEFLSFDFAQMVPAVGQGAIAIQCRAGDVPGLTAVLDATTSRAVSVERAIQSALGGGCHTAFGAHVTDSMLHFFHEKTGIRTLPLSQADFDRPAEAAARVLAGLNLP
jgi:hydroxymethylbilane synthase